MVRRLLIWTIRNHHRNFYIFRKDKVDKTIWYILNIATSSILNCICFEIFMEQYNTLVISFYKRSVRVRVRVILVSLKAKNAILAFTYKSYKIMKTISIYFQIYIFSNRLLLSMINCLIDLWKLWKWYSCTFLIILQIISNFMILFFLNIYIQTSSNLLFKFSLLKTIVRISKTHLIFNIFKYILS